MYENVWEKFSVQSSLCIVFPRCIRCIIFHGGQRLTAFVERNQKFQIQKKERKSMGKGQQGGWGRRKMVEENDSFSVADTLTLE